MPPPSRRLLMALAFTAALALTGTARAEGDPTLLLPFTGEVRAGETVELRWAGIGVDVGEVEILLSIDGGRTFQVRVSPELDPFTAVWRWRVPNLPTSDARLTLRFGREGREIEGGSSEVFRIVGAPGAGPERNQVHEGSWWSGPVPLDSPSAGWTSACEVFDGHGRGSFAESPTHPGASRADRSTPLDHKVRSTFASANESASLPRTPRFSPPRE